MTHRTRARAAIAIRRGFTRSGTDPWGERPPTVPPARSPSTECAICRKAGKPCDLVRHLIQFERTVRPLEYGNEELSRLMAMAARARVRCVIVLETQPN